MIRRYIQSLQIGAWGYIAQSFYMCAFVYSCSSVLIFLLLVQGMQFSRHFFHIDHMKIPAFRKNIGFHFFCYVFQSCIYHQCNFYCEWLELSPFISIEFFLYFMDGYTATNCRLQGGGFLHWSPYHRVLLTKNVLAVMELLGNSQLNFSRDCIYRCFLFCSHHTLVSF